MSNKSALRVTARAVRKNLHGADSHAGEKAADLLARSLFGRSLHNQSMAGGKVFSGYMPINTEFDPRPIMDFCLELGLKGALPVIADEERLVFQAWTPETKLTQGGFSIPIPNPPTSIVLPDFLFVPLLAVDRKGWRVGYGAGYYDYALRALRKQNAPAPIAVGVCYDGQLVDAVPHHDGDERLDWILTETQLIESGRE